MSLSNNNDFVSTRDLHLRFHEQRLKRTWSPLGHHGAQCAEVALVQGTRSMARINRRARRAELAGLAICASGQDWPLLLVRFAVRQWLSYSFGLGGWPVSPETACRAFQAGRNPDFADALRTRFDWLLRHELSQVPVSARSLVLGAILSSVDVRSVYAFLYLACFCVYIALLTRWAVMGQ